jgi:transposase InsO family protein
MEPSNSFACTSNHQNTAGYLGVQQDWTLREPWRNGYVESFNSRIRDECLNVTSFWSLAQARVVISDWKHDYNHHRRHSALGYHPPAPLRCHLSPTNQRLSFAEAAGQRAEHRARSLGTPGPARSSQ